IVVLQRKPDRVDGRVAGFAGFVGPVLFLALPHGKSLAAIRVVLQRRHVRRRCGWRKDRKSTRLNSSHEWISYAVFCLKRKWSLTMSRPSTPTTLLPPGGMSEVCATM